LDTQDCVLGYFQVVTSGLDIKGWLRSEHLCSSGATSRDLLFASAASNLDGAHVSPLCQLGGAKPRPLFLRPRVIRAATNLFSGAILFWVHESVSGGPASRPPSGMPNSKMAGKDGEARLSQEQVKLLSGQVKERLASR